MTSLRVCVFAKQGDARRTEADIQAAIQKGKGFVHFHHTEYSIASAYALLRKPWAAAEWLRRAAKAASHATRSSRAMAISTTSAAIPPSSFLREQ